MALVEKKEDTKKKPVKEKKKDSSKKNEELDIRLRLENCLKKFYKENGREYIIKNFNNLDLKDKLDNIQLYDFEIMIEDEFFDGLDIIPDGHYTKINDIVEFIIKNS